MTPEVYARGVSRMRQRLFARFVAEDMRLIADSEAILSPHADSPFGGLSYAIEVPGPVTTLEVSHRKADEFEVFLRWLESKSGRWRDHFSFRTTAYFLSRDVKRAIDTLFSAN